MGEVFAEVKETQLIGCAVVLCAGCLQVVVNLGMNENSLSYPICQPLAKFWKLFNFDADTIL